MVMALMESRTTHGRLQSIPMTYESSRNINSQWRLRDARVWALLRYRDMTGGIIVSTNDFTCLDIKRQIELLFFDTLLGWGPDNFEDEDRAERDVFFAILLASLRAGMRGDANEFAGE